MREKYESLPLATLKDLAKARGLKGVSAMKKAEVIERMLEEDEKEKQAERETVKEMSANTGDKPAFAARYPSCMRRAFAARWPNWPAILRQCRRVAR